MPAQTIPADHGEGLRTVFDRMRRQQTPADRLLAGRRIKLASFDGEQFDFLWRIGVGAGTGPTDANGREAHRYASLSCAALAGPRRQIQLMAMRLGKTCQSREQSAAISQRSIATSTGQKMRVFVRQASPFFVNIALAVI